jgi:predicted transglutaminase-like cysteine proteinase
MRQISSGHICARFRFGFRRLFPLLLLTALHVGLSASMKTHAQVSAQRTHSLLHASSDATPTRAWIEFCQQHPAECAINASEPSSINLTRSVWRKIVAVNRRVNAIITPLTDRQHWGTEDRWDYPVDGVGDCEDFQILKRKLLIEAGLPRRALRMTVVIDEAGEGHAVLMVRTNQGEFILDNKRNAVLPWHQTGYVYVKREGDLSPTWVSLGGRRSPVATANR